jgi:hypothetical protein
LPHDANGALEIAPPRSPEHLPTEKAKSQFVPISTSSVSCEGASVVVHPDADPHLERKQVVHLHLQAENRDLRIPAQVAWSARAHGRRMLGLQFALALADANTRRTYAHWIVNETRRALGGGQP